MYRTYYTLEAINSNNVIEEKFDSYEEAYDFMCWTYVKEFKSYEGYKPTLYYKIMKYSTSDYNGTLNTMIQPVWR